MFRQILIFLIAFVSWSGCGYQWGNRNESLPGKFTQIAVPVFKNKTQEVGGEIYFTNSMVEEIIRSQKNSITSQDKAEIVLEGELSRVEIVGEGLANIPTLPQGAELVSTYKMYVEVAIRVRKKSDQSILFNERFSGERTYASAKIGDPMFNSANPNYNQSALHENLRLLSQDLMAKAYNLMTESF